MRFREAALAGSVGLVIALAAGVSILTLPGYAAATPKSTDVPVTVIIPDLSPSPTPTSTKPGGGNGNGNSGNNTPKPVPSPTRGTNPDGSPIPPSKPTDGADALVLDHKRIAANEWMIATGTGYTPGEQVQFVLYPEVRVLGSYTSDAAGTVSARFRIPDDIRPGARTVEATGWTSGRVLNAKFVVVTAPAAAAIPAMWTTYGVVGTLLTGGGAAALYFSPGIRAWFGKKLFMGPVP